MPLSDSDRQIVYYSILPSTILSLLGGTFIALAYLLLTSLKRFPFKVVFILSIFDLFHSIGFLIPTYTSSNSSPACQAQAMILQFFTIGSVLWTTYIASSLYFIIVRSSTFLERNLNSFLLSVLVICCISTIVPYFNGTFGLVAGWCWIKQGHDIDTSFYDRYLLFFVPLWILICFNVFLYFRVYLALKNVDVEERTVRSLNKKLKFYPIILVFCFLPYTIKSILELIDDSFFIENKLAFTIIAGVCRTAVGLFNGIVYGLTKRVKNSIKLYFRSANRQSSEIGILISKLENSIDKSK